VTVALFVVSSYADIAPAWAALAGCVALLLPRLRRLRPADARALWAAASPGFCLFVLALAIVVDAVTRHGLASGLRHLVPSGSSFGALLALSFVAAALANVLNNLPATLALVPLVAGAPGPVLAVLLGVNIGPNLAYPGSLATLLWRRRLPERDKPKAREFHLLGALTVPPLLVVTVGALWAALQVG
jgi:arsenical pump membrane protein